MPDPVLVGDHLLEERRGDEVVEVLVGDGDAAVHEQSLHALQLQFAADVLAELPVAAALPFERLAKLVEGHVALAREVVDGLGERLVVDDDAALVRHLELDVLDDQPLHELAHERVHGRHLGGALGPQALVHPVAPLDEFGSEHDVVVNHGHDPVESFDLRPGRGRYRDGDRHAPQPNHHPVSSR